MMMERSNTNQENIVFYTKQIQLQKRYIHLSLAGIKIPFVSIFAEPEYKEKIFNYCYNNKYILKSCGITVERGYWRDPDVNWRIILRWIFRKWEGVAGTGWS
jgi:hypothetical protein